MFFSILRDKTLYPFVYFILFIKCCFLLSFSRCIALLREENIKLISRHVPLSNKDLNDEQFGQYLAGLIDGDGHFSNKQQLVIVFHSSDVHLAYYIKKRLGIGTVKKIKNKNAYLFIISSKDGIIKILSLINGKIRTENKFFQITYNILNNSKFIEFNKNGFCLKLNTSEDLENHWLAGFSDADASFQIKFLDRGTRTEVRLNFQIDQKKKNLLLLIKQFLGGNIGYRKSQDTYYYGSTSFGSAKNVINYFDKYSLLSSKRKSFLHWRKVYLLIQDKKHLTIKGIAKISKIKSIINKDFHI